MKNKKINLSYFSDGTPVYFDIRVSGTPNDIEDNFYYGEVSYFNPKTNSKVIIWFSHIYNTSIGAYADCYEKMQDYIATNPVIDL